MFRYYLLSTIIVIAIGSVIFAHQLRPPDLRISARPTGTPTVEQHANAAPATARPFTGQGPWVLSALPSCFDEQFRVRGPAGRLRAAFPPATDRIAPGTLVRAGDCTVTVRDHDLIVERGSDRLRVPPDASLYRVDGRLVLLARSGGTVEIRRY